MDGTGASGSRKKFRTGPVLDFLLFVFGVTLLKRGEIEIEIRTVERLLEPRRDLTKIIM